MSLISAGAQPNVYTVPEAARLLRVRESWLEREAAARRIPFTMLAGSYRFTSDHLIQIVRMHEIKPPPKPRRPCRPTSANAAPRKAKDRCLPA